MSDASLSADLRQAIMSNDVDQVKQLTTTVNNAMMLQAAQLDAIAVMKYFLDLGGKVNEWALAEVYVNKNWAMHRLMVEREAVDVNLYIEHRGDMTGAAIRAGDAEHVKFLLEHGADPTRCRNGGKHTHIAHAARDGRADIVEMLLPYSWTNSGALVAAAEAGKLNVARFLIDRGFDVDEIGIIVPYHKLSLPQSGTSLHKAVETDNVEMVKLLLSSGANVNVKDGKGRTVAELAAEKDNPMIIALLQMS